MENLNNHKVWKIVGIIILVLLVAKVFGWDDLGSKDRSNDLVSTITVAGKGEVVVVPDIATITFGVTAENLEVAKAQTESDTKMNKIIAFLKEKKVEEKDIKTTNYSIYPRYDYSRVSQTYPYIGKQILAAYVVSQNVEVKIRDISKAGEILAGVGEFGVTDVGGLSFSRDDIEVKNDEARALAIKDAKEQAQILAKSLGVKLVRITSFSENGNYPMYYAMDKMAVGMGGAEMSAPAASIQAGESKITSNVTITYEIK